MDWPVPTLADVLDARRHISPHLRPTPVFRYAALDALLLERGFPEEQIKKELYWPKGKEPRGATV